MQADGWHRLGLQVALLTAAIAGCNDRRHVEQPAPGSASGSGVGSERTQRTTSGDAQPVTSAVAVLPAKGMPVLAAHQVIQGVSAPADALAVTSDGYVASSHADGSLRIWRLDTRTLVRWIPASEVPAHVHPVEMTWDETSHEVLLAAGSGGVVSIDLEGHVKTKPSSNDVDRLRISSGKRLASDLGRWRLESPDGSKVADVGAFGDIVISGDGTSALGASSTGLSVLSIPRLSRGPVIATTPPPASADDLQHAGIAIARDGSAGAACLGGYPKKPKVVVIDKLSTHPVMHEVAVDLEACQVAMSSEKGIAVVADVAWVAGIDIAHGKVLWRSPIGYDLNATSIQLAASGRVVLASLPDGRIRLIDIMQGEPLGDLGYAQIAPKSVWFAAGDRLVVRTTSSAQGQSGAVAGADVVETWDLASGTVASRVSVNLETATLAEDGTLAVERYRYDMKGGCHSFAVGTLADGAPDGAPTPDLWPPKPGKSSVVCVGDRQTVSDVDPASGTIVTGGSKQAVIRPGKPAVPLVDVGGGAIGMSLEIAGGGQWVLGYNLLGDLGTLFVWDSKSGAKRWFTASPADSENPTIAIGASQPVRKGFTAYAMSSDGARLVVGGGDTATVYETATKRAISTVTVPNSGAVSAIAIASDGSLAIGTTTGTLAIVRSGIQPILVPSNGGAITKAHYRSDSKRIATVSEDGGLRIWNPTQGVLAATLMQFADGESISLTPAGAYAGRTEAAERISWVFDTPTEGFRFERYAGTFARPDLVRSRLAGGVDDLSSTLVRPPSVRFGQQPPARVTKPAVSLIVHAEANAGTITELRAYVDGRPAGSVHVGAASADQEISVDLGPGIDIVTVVAFDDGGRASNPLSAEIDATHVVAPRPDVWIVAAGVGWYPDLKDGQQLAAPVKDANAIAKSFKAQAGAGKPYAAAHITLIEDEDVTRDSLDRALRSLVAMKPNDVAIVFLAGHGVKPPGSNEMVFLLSTTAPDPKTWAATGIGWTTIGSALSSVRGRVLVLLDACQAGHMNTELLVPNTELADALVSSQRAGVFVFAASRGDQFSYESDRARGLELDDEQQAQVGEGASVAKVAKQPPAPVANSHDPKAPRMRSGQGYFTGAILASLRSSSTDVNRDGIVELSELVATVQARVAIASRGRQTPWVVRRELFGDYGVARSPVR